MFRPVTALIAPLAVVATMSPAQPVAIPDDYAPPFFPGGRPLEGLVITLDPGHGGSSFSEGYHGSARGVNSRVVEGDLNMRVAGLVFHHLRDAGAEVHLTRRDDRKVTAGATGRAEELGARPTMADATRSHLFLSMHHNAAPRETADGVVILIWPTDSAGEEQPLEVAFADLLREEVGKTVHHTEDFPHYLNEHPLVTDSDLPSAVVEFGFLSNAEFDEWVTRPTSHKKEAVGVYNAVARMWAEHGEELDELREGVLGEAAPASQPTSRPVASAAFPLGEPPRDVWPQDRPIANDAEAAWFLRTWKKARLSDATTFYLEAEFGESVAIRSNMRLVAESFGRDLEKAMGRKLDIAFTDLPAKSLGRDIFGSMKIPMAMTWAEPREDSGEMTQLLLGEPLFLLDATEEEDYYLVQGIDGYCGWVRADAVERFGHERFAEAMADTGFRIPATTDRDGFMIPAGAVAGSALAGRAGGYEQPAVEKKNVGAMVAETALREFLYTPYNFGGRSPLGLDCSGLVGVCWSVAGVQLPRDANQQAIVGRLVATPWFKTGLQPGDNLFFVGDNGKVWHAGISLGGPRFVHASPPEVQIGSLDPGDPLYAEGWAKCFAFARRPAE